MWRQSRPRAIAALAGGLMLVAAAMPAAAQKVVMKIGHPLPPKTGLHVWAEYLKEELDKAVPGKFDIRIFPTSQLGTIPRMIEGTQLGTIEMIEVPPAFLSGVDGRFSVLAAPGIFTDISHGHRTVHDPVFKKAFWKVGGDKGLVMVGLTCDTESDYATVTPIRKLADFRGRKLRVFGSKLEIETLRRVGATGVPMPLAEVIPAIQQRTIDGNKAGIVVFVPFKYQTVAKYVLRPKESIICVTKFASKVWFSRLPKALRQALLDAAAVADKRILPWSIAFNKRMYNLWVKNGGVLTELSPVEQDELRRRLSTVGDDVLKNRPDVLEVYKVMKATAARHRPG